MSVRDDRQRWVVEHGSGWMVYEQALTQIDQASWQPALALQVSTVQALLSLQLSAVPATQVRLLTLQVSTPLQGLPSSQSALTVQQFAIAVWTH